MIRVAFIGAGSVGFTRKLFRDILAVPELRDTAFAFTDLSERNLDLVLRQFPGISMGRVVDLMGE